MKDLHSTLKASLLMAAALSATTQATVALSGFNSCEIVLNVGAETMTGANKWSILVEHSLDDGSTYEAVELKDLLGVESVAAGVIKEFDAAHTAAAYRFGYKGAGSHVRVSFVKTGTAPDIVVGASAILSHSNVAPLANQI